MSRPWFKKSLTLSIAAQSIALRDLNGKVHVLSTQTTDVATIGSVLEKVQTLFKNQSVEVLISHHLVRFLVLPWQTNVVQLQDWQAIAQHAFKKEFGLMANDWQIAVHLYGFGKPILATAIDKNMIHSLDEASKQHAFKIKSISPLLNQCWMHLAEKDWLLIAEPQRLLLLSMQAGICSQVLLDVPPSGQEQQHAAQLVQRTLMQTPHALRPARVLAYVSGEIQTHWQKNGDAIIKQINPVVSSQTHAAWMLNLQSAR